MAKREEENKKKEAMDDFDLSPVIKHNVEFLSPPKKKKLRKKLRKSKSAVGQSKGKKLDYSQCSRSYVFDSKRDKDKGSVKVCI